MNKNDSNAKQGRLTESFKGNMDFQAKHKGEFSLRNLNPQQMKEINTLLEKFIEVPRALSLPKLKYNEHLHAS